jgi:hypothetical protein
MNIEVHAPSWPLLVVGVLVALLAPLAAAENGNLPSTAQPAPPSSTNNNAATPRAPVGHRQPTQSSLPPSLRKDEDRKAADPLGPVPTICRNC